MKAKKATVTKQKGRKAADQPFILELPGKVAKVERYATIQTACRGAVRYHRAWLLVDHIDRVVKITLPDGRVRIGSYQFYGCNTQEMYLQPLHELKKKKVIGV